eukprot:4100106-Pyramimonas_sp.AAC.1
MSHTTTRRVAKTPGDRTFKKHALPSSVWSHWLCFLTGVAKLMVELVELGPVPEASYTRIDAHMPSYHNLRMISHKHIQSLV